MPPDQRGRFTVPSELLEYAYEALGGGDLLQLEAYNEGTLSGENPVLVCSYGDIARAARRSSRKIVHMEHGTGHAFGTAPYPNGARGRRDQVDLFLAPNEYTARLIRSVRRTRVEVIGTPKMDDWVSPIPHSTFFDRRPVIAIAFHWGDRHSRPPESGSAWEHYKEILPALRDRYHLIGHGHPLATEEFQQQFERLEIEWVPDFQEVLRRADLYINDLSSTLYEFLLTGKPVVVLNAPWFRREMHWGIRFWDYSGVGINVWDPANLFDAIDRTIAQCGTIRLAERHQAIVDLYPFPGNSAQRAADVLSQWMAGN